MNQLCRLCILVNLMLGLSCRNDYKYVRIVGIHVKIFLIRFLFCSCLLGSSCSILDQFTTQSGLGSEGERRVNLPSKRKPQTHHRLVHERSTHWESASFLITHAYCDIHYGPYSESKVTSVSMRGKLFRDRLHSCLSPFSECAVQIMQITCV